MEKKEALKFLLSYPLLSTNLFQKGFNVPSVTYYSTYPCLNDIILILTLRALDGVVSREFQRILHAHEFAIPI